MKTFLLAAAALGISATTVLADSTPGIDRREHRQLHRIIAGVKHDQLNRRETVSLLRGQEHVDRLERRAKADGDVTWRERRRIRAAQNHQSYKDLARQARLELSVARPGAGSRPATRLF